MNVNEGKLQIDVYRYPPSYPMSSALLLNVKQFLRYCDICIDDRHILKWRTRKRKIPNMVYLKSLSHITHTNTPQLFLYFQIKFGGQFLNGR